MASPSASPTAWCPRCLGLTGDHPICPRCGLSQAGDAAARLRVVVYRLHEIGAASRSLAQEQATLDSEKQRLLSQLVSQPHARPAPAATGGEWGADAIRNVLLWVGGVLLAIAALIFAAFAWQRLDDAGRAAMLVATTGLSAGIAAVLRERLRATSEVFAALTVALLLIDWFALRRAGLGASLDAPTWWALGTGVVAGSALAAGRAFASARWLMAIAAVASGTLSVFATTNTPPSTAVGFSVLGAAAVLAARSLLRWDEWDAAVRLFRVASGGASAAAVVAVVVGMLDTTDIMGSSSPEPTASLAIAIALTGLPAAVAAASTRSPGARDLLVTATTVAVMSAVAVGWWIAVDAPWVAALTAAVSAAVVVVGAVAPSAFRWGVPAGAAIVAVAAASASLHIVGAALFGPATLADTAWQHHLADAGGPLLLAVDVTDARAAGIAVLSVAVATAALVLTRWRGDLAAAIVPAAGATMLAIAPLAADLSIAGALAATGLPAVAAAVLMAWAARRPSPAITVGAAFGATAAAVPAAGWALATEAGTLVFCTAALTASAAGAALAPAGSIARRSVVAVAGGAFLALLISAALSAGATATDAGVVAVCGAAVVLVAAVSWRGAADDGDWAQGVAALGAVAGVGLAWDGDVHRAVALTLLVPALAAPGLRPDRRWYLVGAAAMAVFATWGWLVAADVRLLEAYTLPAAAGALAAGETHRHLRPRASSWTTYGAAIAVALGPSLAVAVADDVVTRAVMLAAAGAALCWLGAAHRLQAPLVLGAAAILVVAVDTLGPVAADAPRWVSIGIAGAVLVWLGATADRRLAQLRRAQHHLESLN
jgi:hypothetical protein